MTTKRLTIQFLMLFISHLSTSQDQYEKIENEINEQVWKVFKRAYEVRDGAAFNSVHSEDMLRITDSGIRTGPEYLAGNRNWTPPAEGTTISIDLALENAHYRESSAYQVGYYRVVYTREDGKTQDYYGQFHVVLKKENGRWLITQDFDTNSLNGQAVDESMFKNARMLKL
jgi:ketosteroid isomerase-like protein